MRGCVASLLFLLLSLPAFSQCNYSLVYSGEFRASYLDIAIEGNDLWVATSYGVSLFDRGVDPPALVASVAVPGVTRVVRALNGVAYAGSGTQVYTITRSNNSLSIVDHVDAGANVNDLLVTALYLYVATSNGMGQYDLLNRTKPVRTSNVFLTTGANVVSLAIGGSTLYAADSDSSVEAFSLVTPGVPQKLTNIDSLPRPTSVKTAGSRLYVSDGISTDVFTISGTTATKVINANFGATAFAPMTADVIFAAGTDRRFHAVDWSLASAPVDLFAADVAPSGGTINRIGAMQVAGSRMYVAAGDAGLLTYDLSSFTSPYPVRAYATGATTSAAWVDSKLYLSRAAGGITEMVKGSTGSLTLARQWDARVHTLYEGSNGFLITSSGATLFYWTLNSATPTLVTSVTFPSAVTSAVLIGFNVYATLANRTLATANMGQSQPVAQTIAIPNLQPSFIAHSGTAIAIADIHDDGTTTTAFFPTPDFTAAPQTIAVSGIATAGLALSGTTAALYTFRGVNLIDFGASPSSSVIPQTSIVRRLAFNGAGTLFTLTDDALTLWDIATHKATRSLALPQSGAALAVEALAAIPTSDGVTAVAYAATSTPPSLVAARTGNSYYRKALALGDRLYLFDGRAVDVFETRFGFAPHLIGSARPAGIVDFAISPTAIFTATSNGTVNAFARDGVQIAQATLNEGTDVQILAVNSAAGVPWVSIARGCFSGACEKKTLVLDPKTLTRTTILDGGAIDVAEANGRAYAVFDLPAEVRAYSLSDASHPSLLAMIAAEGTKTPVSIAVSDNVYVDGDKLYSYTTSNLTKVGEQYDSYQADLTNTLQYTDQVVRADGGCVLASARTFAPQFTSGAARPNVPGVVKSLATTPGRFYVLTDYSLEVWSVTPSAPSTGRRRGSR